MQLTINLTTQQFNYLVLEAEKSNISEEQVLLNLLDIQIEMQNDLESDMTLDLWDDDVLGSKEV